MPKTKIEKRNQRRIRKNNTTKPSCLGWFLAGIDQITFCLIKELITLDLPTFERPINAI
jgi:hypothetical protein